MSDAPTHYDVLGIAPSSSKADTKAAYVAALATAEGAGDADAAAAVRRAWQVLSDPQQRDRYDEALRLAGSDAPGKDAPGKDAPGTDLEVVDAEVVEGEIVEDDFPGDPTVNAELRPGPRSVKHLPEGVPAFLEQPTNGRRVVAALIDVVTVLAVFLVGFYLAYAISGVRTGKNPSTALIVIFVVWVEVLILGAFVLPTLMTGQTLGKRMTYLMTVDRRTGNLLTPVQVVRRYAIPMLAIPLLQQMGGFLSLFYGLSFSMGRDQTSLADRMGRSVVVVARYRPVRQLRG